MNYRYKNSRIYNEDIILEDIKFFKEEDFFRTLVLPPNKPDIKKLYDILIIPNILDLKLVKTNTEISNEGERFLGYKLIVEVDLNINLTYIVDNSKENICTNNFNVLKSMHIVLPEKINDKNTKDIFRKKGINILPFIEHYDFKQSSKRSLNISILLLLDAKFF